jgi:transcriptional regulator with XRE-family HTH domain
MDVGRTLRDIRGLSGLTQSQLATRVRTSQATISAYESGRKQPSVATLSRLLVAMGRRLAVEENPVREPSRAEHARVARGLLDVLALAEELPTRHEPELRYPRLAA